MQEHASGKAGPNSPMTETMKLSAVPKDIDQTYFEILT
jgi:hypothetical protein